jgi:chitin synthase
MACLTKSYRAGGAYFEPPRGQVYEISEADLKNGGWQDSVASFASYHDQPEHERKESGNSIESGKAPSLIEYNSGGLTVPSASAGGGGGGGQGQGRRSGRSPLARASLVRTGSDIELQDQTSRPSSSEKKAAGSR